MTTTQSPSWTWALSGLSVLTLLSGCGRREAAAPLGPAAPEKSAAVTTVRPEPRVLKRAIDQPASVEPYEETPLFARIAGHVQKVRVDSGDRVKGPRFDSAGKQIEQGQILAELWVPEMEEELKQKKALVAQAQAEVEQAVAAEEAAQANVASARALVAEAKAGRERVQANYDRWKTQLLYEQDLVKRDLFDKQSFEITRNQYKAADASRSEIEAKVGSAEAAEKESEAKRHKAKADIAAARSRVQVAQAEQGRVAALLGYNKIRAPYDGVITSRTIHTGYYLTGTAAKPLFVIARTDIVRIIAEVPEADAVLITDGAPARVRCQVIKDQEFVGKVTRSSWSLDAKTRTLRVQIDLPSSDCLRPGMYAYVTFEIESPKTFALPASAVLTQGDETICYRVEQGKAIRTPIRIGARNSQFVQVLKKQTRADAAEALAWRDLSGQEEIVATGAASLTDGQPVPVSAASKD
jgi:HlyD family secretion protein